MKQLSAQEDPYASKLCFQEDIKGDSEEFLQNMRSISGV